MKTFIVWLTMVFVLSVYPLNNSIVSGTAADKVFHAFLYAITCLLFYTALKGRAGRWALPTAVVLATGYGFLMELAQEFTASRYYSKYDVLANFIGAASAALYVWTSKAYKQETGGN